MDQMRRLRDVKEGSLVQLLPAQVLNRQRGGNRSLRMLGVGGSGEWSCKDTTYVVVLAEPED